MVANNGEILNKVFDMKRNSISTELIKKISNGESLNNDIFLNGDSMFHVNKGIFVPNAHASRAMPRHM